MLYQEYQACLQLRPYIRCIWTLEAQSNGNAFNPTTERILPDGQMEIIFHLGGSFRQLVEEKEKPQEKSFLYGQLHHFLDLIPVHDAKIIGIRFLPHGLYPFTPISPMEFQQQQISLQDLFGSIGREWEEQVNTARDTATAISIIEAFLLKQLAYFPPPDPLIVHISDLIREGRGIGKIKDILRPYRISSRHFQRKFLEITGTKPKTLARIARLQKAIHLAQHQPLYTLTEIGAAAGYFDQAHFIRDFKGFAGQSPRQFFRQQNALNEQFVSA